MANEWAEQKLPTGTDGKERPALWDPAKGDEGGWDVAQGRNGRQWVRDDSVESQLKKLNEATKSNKVDFPDDYPDKDVKSELESIKETQKDMMDAIKKTNETLSDVIKDGNVRTELYGSNVEYTGGILNESFTMAPGSYYQSTPSVKVGEGAGEVAVTIEGMSQKYLISVLGLPEKTTRYSMAHTEVTKEDQSALPSRYIRTHSVPKSNGFPAKFVSVRILNRGDEEAILENYSISFK